MKSERQNKIIELITKNSIGTQEELAEALKQAGFSVTQAKIRSMLSFRRTDSI